MKVAIDIDNTLLTCKSILYKLMSVIEKKMPVKFSNKTAIFRKGDIRRFSNKHKRNILLGNMGNVDMYQEIDGAVDIVNKICENGNSVVFLSSRPNIRFLNDVVLEWLEKNKVQFDFVVINCGDKLKFCKEHGIDLLIDDSERNCKKVSEAGIKTIQLGEYTPDNSHYSDMTKKDLNYSVEGNSEIKGGYNYAEYGDVEKSSATLYKAKTWKDVSKILEKDFELDMESKQLS